MPQNQPFLQTKEKIPETRLARHVRAITYPSHFFPVYFQISKYISYCPSCHVTKLIGMGKRLLGATGNISPNADETTRKHPSAQLPSGDDHSEESELDEEEDEDDENTSSHAVNGTLTAVKHQGPPTKKQRKQITAQQVQMARETAELFKSNIFKLQIDELISEVKIKDAHIARAEKVLHRLYDCILLVPPVENLTLDQAEKLIKSKRVAIPFPDPKPSNPNYRFSYLPPENVSLVGSFGLKTAISQMNGLSIDIALAMPKSLFQPKDYLNYRALYKRSFYLAYLADQLIPITKKNNLPVKISYVFLNDDVLCPVLRLESIKTDNEDDLSFHKTKFTINILIALPFAMFDAKKLLPDKNCARVQSDDELPPTPYYNSSVLSLSTYDYYLKFLYANKKSAEAFKDACTLGRLWLQQRGFGSSISKGGFGHFEFAVLLSALLSGGGNNGNKILLHGFSSYQLFKGVIKYLATMDLTLGYLSFTSQIGETSTCVYNPDGFNTPTIFDKTVKLNLLWKMTKSTYLELRLNAINTLALLNDVVFDRFDSILLQSVGTECLKYDLFYTLDTPEELNNAYGALEKITFITFDNYLKNKLYTILRNALGERATSIMIQNTNTNSRFQLNKRNNTLQHGKKYLIGIQLNPDECDKLVTKGPNDTEDEAAAKFRSFWGAKTSLRKFKDGTIQHCVVWTAEPHQSVSTQIVIYALGLHFHPRVSKHLSSHASSFNALLPTPLYNSSLPINSAANFTLLKSSFDALTKILHNLQLPLGIKSLLPASSGLRKTSILQPVAFAFGNPDFWNDVVLQFESSSRWPDEISALEKTKTAFLLRICEVLSKETNYTAYLSKDESIPFNEDVTLLNILTPDGFGFRARVLTERDEVLYLRAVANAGNDKQFVQEAYFKFNQKYIASVKHTRTVGILSTSFPYYSATVRLFKKWLDAHALLCHFPDELVELIALKPFLDPAMYTVPNSVEKGFLQIINFIASWNWKDDPLILDMVKRIDGEADELDNKLSDKLTVQAYQLIQENFAKIRSSDPIGVKTQFFVGSRDDPSGIMWSNKLLLPIASRLTALARVVIQHVKEHGVTNAGLDLYFTPAMKDFDFVVKLEGKDLLKSSGVQRTEQFKNLNPNNVSFPSDISTQCDIVIPFVDRVTKWFGNEIVFSYRRCPAAFGEKGNFVSGVFIPSAMLKKKFRVTLGLDVKPLGEGDEVVVDKEDIIDQIKFLGGDLVKSVTFGKEAV